MSERSFNLNIPESGSAARIAEGEAARTARLRVSAGSAARLAENERREENRSGNSFIGGSAGFSLRGQGGKVLRKTSDSGAGIIRNAEFSDRAVDGQSGFRTPPPDPESHHEAKPAESGGLMADAAQKLRRFFRD